MPADRINDFMILDKKEVSSLFYPFNSTLSILDFCLIDDSISNTGYAVTTDSGKYLLKLYSNTTDKIETAVYKSLQNIINVPKLYYYDGSKQLFPFSYTITEFIEGVTYIKYVRTGMKYPVEMACEIERTCAEIHKRKYKHDALLDDNLNIIEEIPRTRDKILQLLDSRPGEHLGIETVTKLREFILKNPDLFDRIEAESVLCHGDFGYNNIMVSNGKLYCIDFEFAYSGSIYNDIGRFFRRKDSDVQALIDKHVYNSFAQGYNSVSESKLPSDWLTLARLCDINAMLCLLSYDTVPTEWVADIEHDILYAISQNH